MDLQASSKFDVEGKDGNRTQGAFLKTGTVSEGGCKG